MVLQLYKRFLHNHICMEQMSITLVSLYQNAFHLNLLSKYFIFLLITRKPINPIKSAKASNELPQTTKNELEHFPHQLSSLNSSVYYGLTKFISIKTFWLRVVCYLYKCWRIYQIIFFSYYYSWCWNSIFIAKSYLLRTPATMIRPHQQCGRELLSFLRKLFQRTYSILLTHVNNLNELKRWTILISNILNLVCYEQ